MTDDKTEFKFQLIVCLSYLAIIVVLVIIIVDIRNTAEQYYDLYQECRVLEQNDGFLYDFDREINKKIQDNLAELDLKIQDNLYEITNSS